MLHSTLADGSAGHEKQDTDIDMALQMTDQLSPSHPFEEEGLLDVKLLHQETGVFNQEPNQLFSEEQTY